MESNYRGLIVKDITLETQLAAIPVFKSENPILFVPDGNKLSWKTAVSVNSFAKTKILVACTSAWWSGP